MRTSARSSMTRAARTCGVMFCLLLVGGLVPHAAAQLDAKRAEASRLRAAIDAQGAALSLAAEAYNEASLDRERLDGQVEAREAAALEAHRRLGIAQDELGRRARQMYKHRTALLSALVGARSLADIARGEALTGSVLVANTALLEEVAQARATAEREAAELADLRDASALKEAELADRAQAAQAALARQAALLASVEGEIAEIIEAQRQAELEAARRAAAEEARRAAEEAARLAAEEAAAATPIPSQQPSSAPAAPEPTQPPAAVDPPTGGAHPRASKAVATAVAQLGKPYRWAGSGPDEFDCSGLTAYAWAAAGVSLPHSSRAQFAALPKVPLSAIVPGDLLFYGSPIHHVGIYEGGGVMINAPQTGDVVKRSSIHRSDFAGAARPG